MKVLHLSYSDIRGGAARSAYRLHEGLRREGVQSRMLVGSRASGDPDVRLWRRTLGDHVANRVQNRLGVQYAFMPSTFRLAVDPWLRDAHVLQLGNVHGGWLSHTLLPLLGRGKRVVWTLHDMWAFTGHCGYSLDHERWLTGCGRCPHLDAHPSVSRDATRLNWHLKKLVYRGCELTIVAPSAWMGDLARRSPLLERFEVLVIPYGLDTDVFAPVPSARQRLGLAPDERAVLVSGLDQSRKGGDLVARVLDRAVRGAPLTLIVAGVALPTRLPPSVRLLPLGEILDERELALAYSAADVFLLPTRADNLPNTLLESLACGTPAVATRVGGTPEIVDDRETGFLRPFDADALGDVLAQLLDDAEMRAQLGAAGRERIAARFSLTAQARAYLDLYQSLDASAADRGEHAIGGVY